MVASLPLALSGPVVRTTYCDPDDPASRAPLLDLLPDSGSLAWVRDGEGLVAWGEADRFDGVGAERFSRAQRWWSAWCRSARIDDRVGAPGSGPVAFASFAFDPVPGHSTVVVPQVVVGRRAGRTWITTVGDADSRAVGLRAGARRPAVRGSQGSAGEAVENVRWGGGSRTEAQWRAVVAEAIRRIGTGEIDKVVLARDIVGEAAQPIVVPGLLRRLAGDYPNCWTFSVDGLVGATPELLVRRTGDVVTSRVLAGTVKRRGEEHVDAGLAAALLGSGKDLEEHEYAVHSVAAALAAHCTDLEVPERPHILSLANVQHLATDVTGRLADGATALALAASLHPTAAVCGTPTERALAVIRELEGMDRGRYSGPVGWFDSRGDGEFGIALRCAEVDGSRVRAFAGCGLVAGSDPDSEWSESQAKLLPIRTALQGG